MELHLGCRGRRFKSDRIERCVAQFGRARMFHQNLVAASFLFQFFGECRRNYIVNQADRNVLARFESCRSDNI